MNKWIKCFKILLVVLLFLFPQRVKADENVNKPENSYSYYYYEDSASGDILKETYVIFEGLYTNKEIAIVLFDNLFREKAAVFVPKGVEVISVKIENEALILDVTSKIKDFGGTYYEKRFVEQLLLTAKEIKNIDNLTLFIDGELGELPEGSVLDKEKI